MVKCAFCDKEAGYLPFHCKKCGKSFCAEHRLPENHECTHELQTIDTERKTPEVPVIEAKIEVSQDIEKKLKPKLKIDESSIILRDINFILLKEGESLIADVDNDKNSPYILPHQIPPCWAIRKIWKFIEKSKDRKLHAILNVLLNKLSEYNYNLDPDEIKFLLEWDEEDFRYGTFPYFRIHRSLSDRQYFEFKKEEILGSYPDGRHKITHWYPYNPTTFHYKTLNQPDYIFDEYGHTSIYKGHISGLIIKGAEELPESIGFLSKLRFLCIHTYFNEVEEIKKLPNSFKKLKNLRYLYFYNTDYNTSLIEFPKEIYHLPKLRRLGLQGIKLDTTPDLVKKIAYKYHSQNYVKEGVNKNDANVLGLLEIIAGETIVPWIKEFEDSEPNSIPTCFTTNDLGHVTSLRFTDPGGLLPMRYLPEEIQNLKYLEALSIDIWSPNQVTIPESLYSFLKSLKIYELNKRYE